MTHKNYFEIKADTNYEAGLAIGRLFAEEATLALRVVADPQWERTLKLAEKYLQATEKEFPEYVEEMRGYADGAKIDFLNLFALSLESDLDDGGRCTTFITNDSLLIGHNEDSAGDQARVCLIKKTIKDITIFEILYLNTLGGNSISVNSHGIIQAIDALTQTDKRNQGIPRNIIGRWLSETSSPQKDLSRFAELTRASGYCHNFVDMDGRAWNLESSATEHVFSQITPPFAHTNHYLSELKKFEANDNSTTTFKRFDSAVNGIKERMSFSGLQTLMTDTSNGPKQSLFNERTVGQMIIDVKMRKAMIWLAREPESGWIEYDLDFINQYGS